MKEVEFRFTHGSFQTNEEPVIKIGHVIDTVFINDQGSKKAAQLQKFHKISRRPGKAGNLQPEYCSDFPKRNTGYELGESWTFGSSGAGDPKIPIDHPDPFLWPSK